MSHVIIWRSSRDSCEYPASSLSLMKKSWDRYESFPLLNKTQLVRVDLVIPVGDIQRGFLNWAHKDTYNTSLPIHFDPNQLYSNEYFNDFDQYFNESDRYESYYMIHTVYFILYDTVFRLNMKYLTFKWLVGHENGPDDVKKARWVVYRVAQQVITSL